MDIVLGGPLGGRSIPPDRWIDIQVRALTAAAAPSFAAEGVGAVTSVSPLIMQCQDNGQELAEPGELAQIEVATMQIVAVQNVGALRRAVEQPARPDIVRSEEHTSDLPSLMRNSYAVFCLKK